MGVGVAGGSVQAMNTQASLDHARLLGLILTQWSKSLEMLLNRRTDSQTLSTILGLLNLSVRYADFFLLVGMSLMRHCKKAKMGRGE